MNKHREVIIKFLDDVVYTKSAHGVDAVFKKGTYGTAWWSEEQKWHIHRVGDKHTKVLNPPTFIVSVREDTTEVTYAQKRKQQPVFSGVLKYFPRALKGVANCSFVGNEQHNPGEKLYWNRTKSQDNADAMVRHLIDHTLDPVDHDDGVDHLAKVCWRALATYEKYLEDLEKKVAQ